jgi:hypothetical protein
MGRFLVIAFLSFSFEDHMTLTRFFQTEISYN